MTEDCAPRSVHQSPMQVSDSSSFPPRTKRTQGDRPVARGGLSIRVRSAPLAQITERTRRPWTGFRRDESTTARPRFLGDPC